MAIDNRRDILLLLLYSPGVTSGYNEPIEGRTRIVKMLFLFKKEVLPHFRAGTALSEEQFYEFFAWSFGPFSTQVYDDLNFFQLRGFLCADPVGSTETLDESAQEWVAWMSTSGIEDDEPDNDLLEYVEEQFRLSDKGERWVRERLWPDLSSSQRSILSSFKARLVSAPLRSVLRYVYSNYPETTEKSSIKDSILRG